MKEESHIDINELHQRDLYELEMYIEDFWNFLPIPVCYVNPLHIILSVDQEFEVFSGYNKFEIIGEKIDIILNSKKNSACLKKQIEKNKSISSEKSNFVKKDKNLVPVLLSVMIRKDEEKNFIGYFISFIDTSKSEQYKKKLEIQSKKLKKLDSLKNDFIANITHDFRSPLTAIYNIADLALNYTPNLDEENKTKYEIIYKASLQLKDSIDKLLELAKMDANFIKLSIQQIDITFVLNKIFDFYSSLLTTNKIKITKDIPVKKIGNIYTDIEKLKEIINNVLTNAIKFVSPDSGLITIKLTEQPDAILITIEDNGIGIENDYLLSIFNRFEQVHPGRNSPYQGTGIGLAYARQLTKYLKGEIWAESEGKGNGSRFIIKLKKGKKFYKKDDFNENQFDPPNNNKIKSLIQTEIEKKNDKTKYTINFSDFNKENEFNYKKSKILLIDDDKNILKILLQYLHSFGYKNFITTTDGKEGLELIFEYTPDIIICDYNMPNMKGDQLHSQLINNPKYKKIPFIFLSAFADEQLILKCREMGANAYLKKPIDDKLLRITLEEHLKAYFEYLKIFQLAIIDELTGIKNRRNIISLLESELAVRHYRDLSLIFLDVDNLKKINDKFGHQVGDRVLHAIGIAIKSSIRLYDKAGRYGGDEFIIILPNTNIHQAHQVAEKLNKVFRKTEIFHLDKLVPINASFGISSLKNNKAHIEQALGIEDLKNIYNINNIPGIDWTQIKKYQLQIAEILLNMSDTALYKSKKTICNNCEYVSTKSNLFMDDKCPKCASNDIQIGRNKITIYDNKM